MQNRAVSVAWRTSLTYWIMSVLWILFSDQAVVLAFSNQEMVNRLQTWKGWAFVTVTAALLFVGLHAQLRRWEEATLARLQSESALRESEHNYRTLTENHPDVIIRLDNERRVLFVNLAGERALGRTSAECVGRIVPDLGLSDALTAWLDECAQVVTTKTLHETSFEIGDGPGQRHFEARAVPEFRRDGEVESVLAVARDVTEVTHAKEAQVRAQKLEALGTMAGGIAHDFNNLLFAINGNAEVALSDLSPDHPAHESVQEIAAAGARAAELVRRILIFSRPREQKLEQVLLEPVLGEALKLLRATVPAMVEISSQCEPDLPPVEVDRSQVHQLVLNLGVNAAHAIGNSSSGRIEFDLRRERLVEPGEIEAGDYLVLSVRDSGSGMDGATLGRIFDPFFTTKPVGEGTGLGLSIVHGVMKSIGGGVTVESLPSKGTTFRLYFPAARPAVESDAVAPSELRSNTGGRVLYVDDEPQILRLAVRAMGRLGYDVTACADPREALQAFARAPHDFDFVVTDMEMPHMSGLELVRLIRKARPDTPLVLISGHLTERQVEEARAAGVHEVLDKPERYDELARVLVRIAAPRSRQGRPAWPAALQGGTPPPSV